MTEEQVDTGKISDGYHTFEELYEHRVALFLNLMFASRSEAWVSLKHDDGSSFDGWFVAGLELPTGQVSYHLPIEFFKLFEDNRHPEIKVLETAPWDGHTAQDVVERLTLNINRYYKGL